MKIFKILFLTSSLFLNSQEYLTPINQISFGLNNHTNRDISYFSIVDNNNSVISVATTEKDSTFTDILTTKLDSNLNQIWQKQFSYETNLSYDIPVSVLIDNSNNIYVSFRSSSNQSNSNGDAILLKYDTNGNELWHINFTEYLGLEVYDYRFFKTYLNDSGDLKVLYVPVDGESNIFHFFSIDSNGNVLNNSQVSINAQSFFDNYINDKHVLFYTQDNSGTGNSLDLFIRFIDTSSDETYQLNNQPVYQNNFNSNNLQKVKFLTDSNHNNYLVWQQNNNSGNNQYFIMRIDSNGMINYSINSDSNNSSTFLDAFIDSNNQLSVLSNNNQQLTLIEYEELNPNIILSETTNVIGGSIKINEDNSFLVFTDTNEITLFDENLSLVNEFSISTANIIDDLTKLSNSEIITAETSLDKMYPESDFFTQLDIVINKYNTSQLSDTYSFSGIGTSKAFNQTVMIDNNNDYIVFSQEKLGPDNLSIGGSRAPLHKSISKYNSQLDLIWTLEVPNTIFILGENILIDSSNNIFINSIVDANQNYQLLKISESGNLIYAVPSFQSLHMYFDSNEDINIASGQFTNTSTYDDDFITYTLNNSTGTYISSNTYESQAFIDSYLSNDNDSYTFIYHPNNLDDLNSQKVSIFKNAILESEVELNLPSNYSKIDLPSIIVDNFGTLYFTTSWGSNDNQLHKITLAGVYSWIDLNEKITQLDVLDDGKIFTIADFGLNSQGFIKIYNDDLSLFTSNTDLIYDGSYIFQVGDYIFLNSYFDNLVKVYNENAELIDEFKIKSNLRYAEQNSDTGFVLTGGFGNQISTFQDYSWARGLLHHYVYNSPEDDDSDGIGNGVDQCPDTPQGEDANSNGCSPSQLDDDNDGITNDIDECPDTEPNLVVNELGCSEEELDDDNDGITNNIDLCPETVYNEFVDSQGCFFLPNNNFTIQTTGETCIGENNGQISINTNTILDYRVEINDLEFTFNDSLNIDNLPSDTYQMCIYVDEENYQQCFNIDIISGTDLSGRTILDRNHLNVEINQGTPPYSIYINSELKMVTNNQIFSIEVNQGDYLQIFSKKSCEGVIEKSLDLIDQAILRPNPTSGNFKIIFNSDVKNIPVIIYDLNSQIIYNKKLNSINNRFEIDISNYSHGIYFVKLGDTNPKYFKLIKN